MSVAPPICPRCGWEHHTRSTFAHTLQPCANCQYIDTPESDEAAALRDRVTTVPCPACVRCTGCKGTHTVTQERAAEINAAIKAQGGPHS